MDNTYINKLVEYEINSIPEILCEWLSKEEIRDNITVVLNYFFNNKVNVESNGEFLPKMKFPSAVPEDFDTHILNLGKDKFVLSSISFRENYKGEIPFVEIYFKNFDMSELSQEELNFIEMRYKVFNPKWISYTENERNKNRIGTFRSEVDTITMVGNIESLKPLRLQKNYDEIDVEKISSMDFYQQYSEEYDSFLDNNEILRDNQVIKESFETLENVLHKGYLYKATIDNKLAGIIGILKKRQLYFKCFFVLEELLFEEFRGKGYGPSFQRKVIDYLPPNEHKIICGVISPLNIASLKTASKCGRIELDKTYIIKLTS